MTHYVFTQSFCGMTIPHGEYEDHDDAKARVKRRIKWLESEGFEVERLNPSTWEVTSNTSCSDHCGVIRIAKQMVIQ